MGKLQIGFSRLDITPPLGTHMAGYYVERLAEGILDPLEVNAVAVSDGERLLVSRYRDRPFRGWALIAGFVEIGETLEDTVRREVLEETGLRVKNLRYYKSQPWSFSDTLLAGFYCDLDGSDAIRIEEDELSEALWLPRGEIPPRGNDVSLTAEMMERFRLGQDGLPV